MSDRLQFAAVGAFLGALMVLLFWLAQNMSFSHRYHHPAIGDNLLVWLKNTSAICAAIGFVFKDRVGDVVGALFSVFFSRGGTQDGGRFGVPRWLAVVVIAVAIDAGLRFAGMI